MCVSRVGAGAFADYAKCDVDTVHVSSRFIQIKNSINLFLQLIFERLIDFEHK